jgi:hypothetical protein
MKSDQLRFGLCAPGLAGFGEHVIHMTTHSKWGQLWMIGINRCWIVKKNRDLSRSTLSRAN